MKIYKITATIEDSNGVRVDANCPEVLGEAWGMGYLSFNRAKTVLENLETDMPEGYKTVIYEISHREVKTLEIGPRYDLTGSELVGWTEGDGSGSMGYDVSYYFHNGYYLGPDICGIEPIFKEIS